MRTIRRLPFAELHRQAQNVAALLLEKMPATGRALLLFPPGLDYVRALYGCFQAGIVAVSAPPPQPNRLHRTLPRLEAIAADAEISAVLTIDFIREAAQSDAADSFLKQGGPLTEVQWIATDTAPEGGEIEVARPDLSSMAFLQYTSGSTRDPRGVVLSHDNLMGNSDLVTEALGHIPNGLRKGLSWLPPYHDMGLIAGVLQPVHAGGRCIMMSPLTVIKRPARWLEAMSKYRVTTSGGPNFAYDLCVAPGRPTEQLRRLDLSAWEVAFNGAEPIRAETLDALLRDVRALRVPARGLPARYGLAEATLLVTASAKESGADDAGGRRARARGRSCSGPPTARAPSKTLVGSGAPFEGTS